MAVDASTTTVAPGTWDNEAKKITLAGAEVQESLTQLIDPTDEVRVPLNLVINGSPGLPTHIKTERLLYGGGLAIVGTADYEEQLPFSLRSRILFDDSKGELIFRGYYDGTSAQYIKGDPLLLLNVMSESDRTRLLRLCLHGSPEPRHNLPAPHRQERMRKVRDLAVNALYALTLNPRRVDLCRDSFGKLYPGDPEPSTDQYPYDSTNAEMSDCRTVGGSQYYRDGFADEAFLVGVQDADDDGTPEARSRGWARARR